MTTNVQNKQKRLVVDIDSFAAEILGDLPLLYGEKPNGIYLADLQDMYGESSVRIKNACKKLESQSKIVIRQSHTRAFYILPIEESGKPAPLRDLTELQRRLVIYLHQVAAPLRVALVKTSYSHLAQKLGASYGGIHECVNRCQKLGYLTVESPGERGKPNSLVIRIRSDLNLTS